LFEKDFPDWEGHEMILLMTAVLALLAILIPASVTVLGYLIKRQSDNRLQQEKDQSDARLDQEHAAEQARLRLDAAMRAASLFGPVGDTPSTPAASASGLLALTQLGRADLAVALLVDLWSVGPRSVPFATGVSPPGGPVPDGAPPDTDGSGSVSTETAVLVINAALEAHELPNAQLVAAELLCRNATRLDPCQSLHWPASIDGRWLPDLATAAKLLVIEGLHRMTTRSPANENALRSLAVRLYGVWNGDPNERVRGCVGTLINAILPALERLRYTEFLQAGETVSLDQLRTAAMSARTNPDGFLDKMVRENSSELRRWSMQCRSCEFGPEDRIPAMA
jgi:hypothetical protein